VIVIYCKQFFPLQSQDSILRQAHFLLFTYDEVRWNLQFTCCHGNNVQRAVSCSTQPTAGRLCSYCRCGHCTNRFLGLFA